MPEVMGRGQAFFPDDPGYTMPGWNELWSFLRDYHQTPGPAANDPVSPNVRPIALSLSLSLSLSPNISVSSV